MDIPIHLTLSYQKKIFNEVINEDGLCVMAPGLSLLQIAANVLAYFAVPRSLVLLVGANSNDNELMQRELEEELGKTLQIVNTETMSVDKREKAYQDGGIFSVTSRILVMDLLTHIIPTENITGLVLLHADRIVSTGTEAFIIRLYREKNKTGFIKAFSDDPERFLMGINALSNALRCMFLRHVFIYPRFHVDVTESLEKTPADVIELNVDFTDSQKSIQSCLLSCIEATVRELRRYNSAYLDMEEWNIDSALHRSFDVTIRRQLDPVWHRVSPKSKQLVGDLSTLKFLLNALISYDCVSFLKILDTIILSVRTGGFSSNAQPSPWLMLDSANTMIRIARDRVYRSPTGSMDEYYPVLEEQPKWSVLRDVLEEISHENILHESNDPEFSTNSILIMCSEERTCLQLRDYLSTIHYDTKESFKMMNSRLMDYFHWREQYRNMSNSISKIERNSKEKQNTPETSRKGAPASKRRRVRGGGIAASRSTTESNLAQDNFSKDIRLEKLLLSQISKSTYTQEENESFEVLSDTNSIYIYTYNYEMDTLLLNSLRPRFIIMFDSDPDFIRRIEVYKATYPQRATRVYFIYYGGSVEEQKYLYTVRREKDSFSKLIRERSNMAVVLTGENERFEGQETKFLRNVNTRIAGGGHVSVTNEKPRIVVDLREFRSSLPSILHGNNFSVIPCQLLVGDYVLSPNICVERKSIRDLIQSLSSGRLYSQCEAMLEHYEVPVLLIEFEQNQTFTSPPFSDLSTEIGKSDVQSKLVLLTIAFPKLRILWSSSAYATSLMFQDLKSLEKEPDPAVAASIGLEAGQDSTNTYNQAPVDLLMGLPYISMKNYKNVIYSDVINIQDACEVDERKWSELIGPEAGRSLYTFFRKKLKDYE
ncbi:DNA repair endonuclease XPF [Schizosaccharomyces cryophilus OY26]|uniref:DNA repair endonuclease XPF n=1 Tax=Schizosaccharomyces cryophilus (strain OY26 / ATCC MYA-4695 / CBS 11777 / NBRC 106824 / NRRL Y48691) TaxID=653667 RepID=S9VUU2_SCHCR|nr:DNA repair endonuclease XPF [Schizosaccharomyces cryophilus OY26]EPY49939.1 DNA repair endonuclease XPF [Schizosaccharomyces cryophilus OY26]